MNLNSLLLFKNLKETYSFKNPENISNMKSLGRPRFLSDEDIYLSHTVYITDSYESVMQLTGFPSTSLLLYTGPSLTATNTPLHNICLFAPRTNTLALFNQVQKIFDYYDDWEISLRKSERKHAGVQTLLETGFTLLQNHLMVISSDFDIIAMTDHAEHGDPASFGDTKESFDNMTAMKQDQLFLAMAQSDDIYTFPDHITGERSLNINIKQNGLTAYRLILRESNHPFEDGDELLLKVLSSFVAYTLLNTPFHRPRSKRPIENLLHRIISDRTADYMALSNQLTDAGWDSSQRYLAIALRVTYLDQKNLTIHALSDYIEQLVPNSCAFDYKNEIIIYVNVTLANLEPDEIVPQLITFARDSFLKMGYSRVMIGHMNLRRQYLQAHIAITVGDRISPYLWKHNFNDIVFPYMMEQLTRTLPGYMLCHEGLLTLKEMDQSHNTEYLPTLRTYLKHQLNAVQTAKALYIHRSTLLYRLEKISDLLEIDFNNYKEVLYLLISLELMYPEHE